ncbi:transposase [Pseudoxanthomonas sp. LH2527]|uniref:REP-associated tyrosine transposase n=1 Tax=Pseudoxanthomonas sp. LH2527 TaxID=2923249 RepID=UPI001F12F5B2|nr:transposase [Pseudoxanthomonas sp. LH2527]MCH6483781.1 transposase [Pseudoxanthomonas sp. LH2527]
MASFRRVFTPGATWFFTVVAARRRSLLTDPRVISAFGTAMREVRPTLPFSMPAWVILPDHLHVIWTLPEGDTDYPRRWSIIKRRTSQLADLPPMARSCSMAARRESGLWQRRYWEHLIRDSDDLHRHVDYIHFNPVRHGHKDAPVSWPYSSFARHVRDGTYPPDWCATQDLAIDTHGEP